MNPTKRCYVCKQLGHLRRNYVNHATKNSSQQNKGKTKANEIKTHIKWIRKYEENSSQGK